MIEAPLEEPVLGYYKAAAKMWNQLRREFLYAAEQARHIPKRYPACPSVMFQSASYQRPCFLDVLFFPVAVPARNITS